MQVQFRHFFTISFVVSILFHKYVEYYSRHKRYAFVIAWIFLNKYIHIVVCQINNNSQIVSKCGENKKVAEKLLSEMASICFM